MMATMTASTRRSDYGMSCVQCGDLLIAPEWSEYEDERHVLNLWSCTKCGYRFETEVCVPADAAKSVSDDIAIKAFFPSLLVA
jgi:predicted Zn-ribbon and HTH transcriptional regulator